MKYYFSDFVLDTDKKQLFIGSQLISLTKQHYDLLLLLVKNSGILLSKEKLIVEVWNGRVIEKNTINRSISKLRHVLNDVKEDDYFEAIYGRGIKFLPAVDIQVERDTAVSSIKISVFILLTTTVLLTLYFFFYNTEPDSKNGAPRILLVLPSDTQQIEKSDENSWLSNSSDLYLKQLLGYSNIIALKDYGNKPRGQSQEEYLQKQWEIAPLLQTISTDITYVNEIYSIQFTLTNRQQVTTIKSFNHTQLSQAFKLASQWLDSSLSDSNNKFDIQKIIPANSYLIELYLRGLYNHEKGEFEKAEHFFELCLQENPQFHMARLELARSKSRLGNQNESLALLDTLSTVNSFPALEIEIGAMRGNILEKQGKHIQSRDISLKLISKFKQSQLSGLNKVRRNLSRTYSTLTEYDLALQQLEIIESEMSFSKDYDMLAGVLREKGSLLQKIGRMEEAKISAIKAIKLLNDSGDVLGKAGIYILLGGIATHQSNYQEAEQQFNHALVIVKNANYKVGIGATLNELTYIAMSQGQLNKAWELNLEMEKIAIEIDYKSLLLASKELSIQITRVQKKWFSARLYLDEHKKLASEINNQRALINNKKLRLELLLDQKITKGVREIISDLQLYIDQTNEVRLQPRLDKQLAKYYMLTQNVKQGLDLFLSAKLKAQQTEDAETIIEINNLLAEYYLITDNPQKALGVLEESIQYGPVAYPYLLLKAKAYAELNNVQKAVELANECKTSTPDLWSVLDEKFLSEISRVK